VRDAQLVEPRRPGVEIGSRRDTERYVVQSGSPLVERVARAGLVMVQPDREPGLLCRQDGDDDHDRRLID
jgi:hypothetical protein